MGILIAIFLFQAFAAAQAQPGPFEEIRESDPRVGEIRVEIASGNARGEFLLRYGGTRDDFLSFYDRVNDEIYFRYREDRFDVRSEKKIRNLIEGEPYRVFGSFSGVILAGIFYQKSHPDFVKLIRDPNSIPVFDYVRAEPIRLDELLL